VLEESRCVLDDEDRKRIVAWHNHLVKTKWSPRSRARVKPSSSRMRTIFRHGTGAMRLIRLALGGQRNRQPNLLSQEHAMGLIGIAVLLKTGFGEDVLKRPKA
jgi:hypothetical protein